MAVLFSQVTVSAGNGDADTFLCGGIPHLKENLQNWTAYQKFMKNNPNEGMIDVEVKSYIYGDGEIVDANKYEIAYFINRGDDFLGRSTVKLYDESNFIILTDNENMEKEMN